MIRYSAEPAFVLHARPWRETSLLVEVLGAEHGRIGLVARGVQGGPKRHPMRAALQPLQHIRLDAVQRGELAQLRAAEALDAAPVLGGDAALAGFYLNELTLRLAPRLDPAPELYAAYAQARERLGEGNAVAWTMRRFERDLLDALGFGLALDQDGDGQPIDPAARYVLEAEHGPRRSRSANREGTATGAALLALAEDAQPAQADLASLRLPLRAVLLHHLGGRGLKSWEVLGDLGRLLARAPRVQEDGG